MIQPINWYGFNAWHLENKHLHVVIVPTLGAKIVSLLDKAANHEWLAPPSNPLRLRQYGDSFLAHDLSGWDEMFPTIVVCPSPFDAQVQLPDHGEVWALPWELVAQTDHELVLRVEGHHLPYSLTRSARLQGERLRLSYTAENRGDQPLPFLWAAHPLFNTTPETRIGLPEGVTQVINTADHPRLGPPDRPLSWPQTTLPDGSTQRLDRVEAPSLCDYRKFYTLPSQPVSNAWLWQPEIMRGLHLSWDEQTAPYLGVWVDEGTYTRSSTAALEPSSGYYDSLALAQQNQRTSILPARGKRQWWLEASVIGAIPAE